MTGDQKSKKPANETDADADANDTGSKSPGSGDAEPRVRPPRDTSGSLIAVEVEEPTEADGDGPATSEEAPDPVAELTAQLDKKQNQLLRVAADFDNYKKRSRRDAREAAFRARNELLQEMLPVVDNLELALSHTDGDSGSEADAASLRKGVDMVLRQFQTTMEKYDVKALDSLGEVFDPNFHEALQQRETDEQPPGTVVEEFRRGYVMGDRLIRPAMVVVAAAPASNKTPDNDGADDDAPKQDGEG